MISHFENIVKRYFVDIENMLVYNVTHQGGANVNQRIKKIREYMGMTQEEFGKRIGAARNTIANYETGNRNPSNAVITSICREFNINEEWLRYGIEPMKKSHEDDVAECIEDLLSTDNPFYEIIKGIMITYKKLDDKSRKVIENCSEELAKELVERSKKND